MFLSAYEALQPSERAFVDGYIDVLDIEAARSGERMPDVLRRRVITEADITRSRGLLARGDVKAAIRERSDELTRQREVAPAMVLNEVAAIGFSDIRNYMQPAEDGRPCWDFVNVKPEHWRAIKSIKWDDSKDPLHPKVELVLHDKIAGLQMYMKYLGLTDEDNQHWAAERARRLGPTPVIDLKATEQEAAGQYARLLEAVA